MHFPEAKLSFIEKLETAESALYKYSVNLTLRLRELQEETQGLQRQLDYVTKTRKYLSLTLRSVHGPQCKVSEYEGKCTCV